MSKGRVLVSRASLKNLRRELLGLAVLVKSREDCEEKDEALATGLEEILYNVEMLADGVEYVSDEYQYLAEHLKEVEWE